MILYADLAGFIPTNAIFIFGIWTFLIIILALALGLQFGLTCELEKKVDKFRTARRDALAQLKATSAELEQLRKDHEILKNQVTDLEQKCREIVNDTMEKLQLLSDEITPHTPTEDA